MQTQPVFCRHSLKDGKDQTQVLQPCQQFSRQELDVSLMMDVLFWSKTFPAKEPVKEEDALNVTKLSPCPFLLASDLLYSSVCLRNLAEAYRATAVTAAE